MGISRAEAMERIESQRDAIREYRVTIHMRQ